MSSRFVRPDLLRVMIFASGAATVLFLVMGVGDFELLTRVGWFASAAAVAFLGLFAR